jgi:hypothetical protein
MSAVINAEGEAIDWRQAVLGVLSCCLDVGQTIVTASFKGPRGQLYEVQCVHAGRRISELQHSITRSEMHTQYTAPCQLVQPTVTLRVFN